jgi:hypothetical protein
MEKPEPDPDQGSDKWIRIRNLEAQKVMDSSAFPDPDPDPEYRKSPSLSTKL